MRCSRLPCPGSSHLYISKASSPSSLCLLPHPHPRLPTRAACTIMISLIAPSDDDGAVDVFLKVFTGPPGPTPASLLQKIKDTKVRKIMCCLCSHSSYTWYVLFVVCILSELQCTAVLRLSGGGGVCTALFSSSFVFRSLRLRPQKIVAAASRCTESERTASKGLLRACSCFCW